nr:alpha/beta hydrolase [Xanthomonadaceae bacterium]
LFAILILCAWLAGCEKDPPKPDDGDRPTAQANSKDPHWVYPPASPPARVAVVFIHGLFGDTDGTWTDQKSGRSFFEFVKAAPGIGEQVDIFAFGFTSKMAGGGSLDIREASNKLYDHLRFHGLMQYDTIVFVAHSMGGLVAMRTVIGNPELSDKTPLMVLYATPQEGSQIAQIGKLLIPNNALGQMTPADANDYLKQLSDDWVRLKARGRAPFVECAYETKATFKTMIVPWSSATRFCDAVAPGIGDADHLSIVKPDRPQHDAVIRFVVSMQEHVLPRLQATSWETPNFTDEDRHWVYSLGKVTDRNPAVLKNASKVRQRYEIAGIADSSLLILPALEPGKPRELPPGQSETLQFVVLGDLRPEYRFDLKLSSLPARTVLVRIPNLPAAQAERDAQQALFAQKIRDFIAAPEQVERFKRLPEAQTQAAIADFAKSTLAQRLPGLNEGGQWLLASDALARINFLDSAAAAMGEAKTRLPAAIKQPSVEQLDQAIRLRSNERADNERADRVSTPLPRPIDEREAPTPEASKRQTVPRNARQQAVYLDLAEQAQKIDTLKREGLVLEGDVLNARGDRSAAAAAYRDAGAIRPSPVVTRKLEAVSVDRDR